MNEDLVARIESDLLEAAAGARLAEGAGHQLVRAGHRRAARRRALTVALPVAAVVAAVVTVPAVMARQPGRDGSPITAIGSPGPGAVRSRPASTPPTVVPPQDPGPPEVAYLVGRTLHLGSRTTSLPSGWVAVNSMVSAAGVVVLDVMPRLDEATTAVLGRDGVLSEVSTIVNPVDISRDGTLVLALARVAPAPVDTRQPVPDVVVHDLVRDAVVARLPGGYLPVQFLGAASTSALVTAPDGSYRIWDPATSAVTQAPLSSEWVPLAVSPKGDLWIGGGPGGTSTIAGFRAGSGGPLWTLQLDDVVDARFSLDGRQLAVAAQGQVLLVDPAHGRRVGVVTDLGVGHWHIRSWEPSGTLLLVDDDHPDVPLQRCDLTTSLCASIPATTLVARLAH